MVTCFSRLRRSVGSFELLVHSEFPMRGVVCLLESPCGSPREMGLGNTLSYSKTKGLFQQPLRKPWKEGVG